MSILNLLYSLNIELRSTEPTALLLKAKFTERKHFLRYLLYFLYNFSQNDQQI